MGPLYGPKKGEQKGGTSGQNKRPGSPDYSRSDEKKPSSSPNRSTRKWSPPAFFNSATSLLLSNAHHTSSSTSSSTTSSPSSPSHSSHGKVHRQHVSTKSSTSNLLLLVMATLLSVLGILLSIAAVVLIVQLQTRVDSLEQRCAHYESVFAVLTQKLSDALPPMVLEVDVNNNSPVSGNVSPLGDDLDKMSMTTIDPLEDLVRRLSSSSSLQSTADEDNLANSSRISSLLTSALRSATLNDNKRSSLLDILPEEQDQFDQFVHEVSGTFSPRSLSFCFLISTHFVIVTGVCCPTTMCCLVFP